MPEWRYRGRTVTTEEIDFIRRLVAEHPAASRRRLSEKLCEAWQWKQANGALRDMVCRGLLLMLHRAGQIELPQVRYTPPNPLARRDLPGQRGRCHFPPECVSEKQCHLGAPSPSGPAG